MFFIVLLLTGFCSSESDAQNLVRILSSERGLLTTIEGQSIRKLYNARLQLQNVTMVCDSAWQYLDRNELQAFGNIQIDTPTENIWADTLIYFTNRDVSRLLGRVVIVQDSTTLFGEEVDYNFLTKNAVFKNGIRLEDDAGTLTATTGIYFQNQDSAVFRGQVQIADSAQYAEGDSLFINRARRYYQLHSRIMVVDSTNLGILMGDFLEADSTGRRFVDGNAFLRKVETDSAGADTSFITSKQLLMIENDSTETINAYGDVNTWSVNYSTRSDSLFYDASTEKFLLSGNPRAWYDRIQLNGSFISMKLDSSSVEYLVAWPGAFAVQEDSASGLLNQLRADTLKADFDDGSLSTIDLYPNSTILFHTKNDAGESDGAIESSSPQTILYFSDGELEQAKMGQNTGFFIPQYEGLRDRTLDGFSWDPDMRPERPERNIVPRFGVVPATRPFTLPVRYLKFTETE